jgi:hypothetical protein
MNPLDGLGLFSKVVGEHAKVVAAKRDLADSHHTEERGVAAEAFGKVQAALPSRNCST